MNELILRRQGTEIKYTVISSGFSLTEGGKLSLSIESELSEDDEESPREIYLCVENCDLVGVGDLIHVIDKHDWADKGHGPHAYVYSGFHHEFVEARVNVKSLSETVMDIKFTIVTEDVDFYDERATDSGIVGFCRLASRKKSELWNPA